jgi:hypothetical protein
VHHHKPPSFSFLARPNGVRTAVGVKPQVRVVAHTPGDKPEDHESGERVPLVAFNERVAEKAAFGETHDPSYACCSFKAIVDARNDPGRASDIDSSLIIAFVVLVYGFLRTAPRYGLWFWEAGIVSGVAPFVYAVTFFVSATYHISLPWKLASAITREMDYGMVQVSLALVTVVLVCAATIGPHGDLPVDGRWQVWADAPLAAIVAIATFAIQRSVTPPQQTHRWLNDPSSVDARHIHGDAPVWRGLRRSHSFAISTSWILQLWLIERPSGLCDRASSSPPTLWFLLATVATIAVGALIDDQQLWRFCTPTRATSMSHTVWHLCSAVGLLLAMVASDVLLSWRFSNACAPAQ